jgi:hypothetical protein
MHLIPGAMTNSSSEEIERLLAEHGPRRPARFAALTPLTELIRGLRERGGSFETIQAILRSRMVEVSRTTIRNFCGEVLGETPVTSRKATKRLRPKVPYAPPQRPAPEVISGSLTHQVVSAHEGPTATVPTPTPQVRGPRVARVRMLSSSTSTTSPTTNL